ncbi:hypothetical protein MRY87_07790 [bacterium]|nr:hypothetical protein [bacterium]
MLSESSVEWDVTVQQEILCVVSSRRYFGCGWYGRRDTPQKWSESIFGELVTEAVPAEVYRRLLRRRFPEGEDQSVLAGEVLGEIFFLSGPGSYTGLRMALSFVKGIAAAGQIPLSALSRFEVVAAVLLKERAEGRLLLGMELGRESYLVVGGSTQEEFRAPYWRTVLPEEGREELRQQPKGGGYELKDGAIMDLSNTQEVSFSYEDAMAFAVRERGASTFSVQGLSEIVPEYGSSYSVMNVEQQRAFREQRVGKGRGFAVK